MRRAFGLVLAAAAGVFLVDVAFAQSAADSQGQAPATRTAVSTFRVDNSAGKGSLLFIGTRHSNDPSDPQMTDLAALLGSNKPDVVLVEGGRWPLVQPPEAAITQYGELAYASSLARGRGIRVEESDPPLADEIAHVVEREGADRARMLYALRMVPQFLRTSRVPGDIATRLARWLRSSPMQAIPGSDAVATIDELERLCRSQLPQVGTGPCWSVWGSSEWTGTWLDEVRETSSRFRDAYTLDRVLGHYLAGRRVMVVAGLAHLDSMRTTFRTALERRRQP